MNGGAGPRAKNGLPPGLRDRVLGAARSQPSPTIGTVSRARIAAIAFGFVPLVAIFQVIGGCALSGRPFGYVVLNGIGWGVLTIGATWGALGRGGSMLGRPWQWLAAITVATPVLLLGIAYLGYVWWPDAAAGDCPAIAHVKCFLFGMLMALGPLAAFAYARRYTDPVHPRLTGAAVGAAAGAWGALAIGMHCPGTMPFHVLAGHVTPVFFLTLLGVWIGARNVDMAGAAASKTT
jgi:hypothetical protein